MSSIRRIIALHTAGAMAGCAHYAPQPISSAVLVSRPTRFDGLALGQEVQRLAPSAHYDPQRWDRVTLLAAALLYNPDIAAARATVASAQAAARAARASAGPTLTLSSEYAGAATEASPWLFGGALDIPLDLGGRRRTRIDGAVLAVEVARYDYAEAVWTTRMAVRRALASRLVAERQVTALDAALSLRQRQFAAMERRVNAGEAPRTDLERVRLDLADTARRAQEAGVQIVVATAALAATTGIAPTSFAHAQFIWDHFDEPAPPVAVTGDTRIAALVSRSDVLKAVAAYDASENDLRSEIAKQYPAISIAPGYTWERGLVKLPFNIGLALPPLDLNRRAIAAAETRRAETGKRLEAVLATAGVALTAAEIELSAATKSLQAIRSGELVGARRLAQQADRELKSGAIDRTDWAAAQGGLAAARLSELDALARLYTATAALEDAARRPLEGPELAITANRTLP